MAEFEGDPRVPSPSRAPASSVASSINLLAQGGTSLSFAVDEEVREREDNGWEFSTYRVVTTYQGQPFAVNRRYKEFKQLHAQMRVHAPSLPPDFPLWGNLLNRFAPEVIEERKLVLFASDSL